MLLRGQVLKTSSEFIELIIQAVVNNFFKLTSKYSNFNSKGKLKWIITFPATNNIKLEKSWPTSQLIWKFTPVSCFCPPWTCRILAHAEVEPIPSPLCFPWQEGICSEVIYTELLLKLLPSECLILLKDDFVGRG